MYLHWKFNKKQDCEFTTPQTCARDAPASPPVVPWRPGRAPAVAADLWIENPYFCSKITKWRYRAQKSIKMHAYTMTPLVQVTSLSDEKCDCIRSFSGVSALIQTLRIKNKKNISLTHLLVSLFFSANYLLLRYNLVICPDVG